MAKIGRHTTEEDQCDSKEEGNLGFPKRKKEMGITKKGQKASAEYSGLKNSSHEIDIATSLYYTVMIIEGENM